MAAAASGVINTVKNVGKELTGDAERERKRAARDLESNVRAAQNKLLDQLNDKKKADSKEDLASKKLLERKRLIKQAKSTGRAGTIKSTGLYKTLLGE